VLDVPADWTIQRIVSECAWEACVCKGILLTPIAVYKKDWEQGVESSSLLAIAVRQEGVVI